MTARELSAAHAVQGRDTREPETAAPRADGAAPEVEGSEIEIQLADLIGDENGETVLFNDSSARTLRLISDVPVVDQGRVDRHVTGGGADVSGFRYARFTNGLTIFFEEGLGLIVQGAGRATDA